MGLGHFLAVLCVLIISFSVSKGPTLPVHITTCICLKGCIKAVKFSRTRNARRPSASFGLINEATCNSRLHQRQLLVLAYFGLLVFGTHLGYGELENRFSSLRFFFVGSSVVTLLFCKRIGKK